MTTNEVPCSIEWLPPAPGETLPTARLTTYDADGNEAAVDDLIGCRVERIVEACDETVETIALVDFRIATTG
jgi:hypothetical protein